MSVYIFELDGCTSANVNSVQATLASIQNIKCSIYRTAKGSYILRVESALTRDEVLALLNKSLGSSGIKVIPATEFSAIVVGPAS